FVDGRTVFLTPTLVNARRKWRSHQGDYFEAYHHQGVRPLPKEEVVFERERDEKGKFI
ncbi:hypothetical protein HY345_01685, partial [Candidatus Microgenomates bacterium]|nr:hypothetical protein [Candidatus Microgenomates bacterium]